MRVLQSGKLPCSSTDLDLNTTLFSGQSFRWRKIISKDLVPTYVGVVRQHVWELSVNNEHLHYTIYQNDSARSTAQRSAKPLWTSRELVDYFRLDANLAAMFHQWASGDRVFRASCKHLHGLRLLQQDPVENLFSFICSSNNNIARITSLVDKLCSTYGNLLGDIGGGKFFTFPRLQDLDRDDTETQLRLLGFGYRAKFIRQSARLLMERGGEDYLVGLRSASYDEALQALLSLPGVGRKVADCVCVMSLCKDSAVPIDTHMHQIALLHYLPQPDGGKSLTDLKYKKIGDRFRQVHGTMAGWAQLFLFACKLGIFQTHANCPDCIMEGFGSKKTVRRKRIRVREADDVDNDDDD